MRILHVVGGLANSSGTTHIIWSLATHQARLGHDVSIYYVSGRAPDTVLREDSEAVARGFPLSGGRRWGYSRSLGRELLRSTAAFDLVHVHSLWLFVNYAVARACRRHGVPYVVSPQGTLDAWTLEHHGLRKRIYGAVVERRLLRSAAAIHAVTEEEARQVRAYGVPGPILCIPNGVDVADYAELPPRDEARRVLGLAPSDVAVLHLGRLHPKKGIDLLIETFATLARRRPEARLLVAGSDGGTGYRAVLEGLVRASGFEARVRFLGEVRGADKAALLAGADVFALLSHSEGLPVASLEALAAGLPVLLTEGCYVPEVQARGAGRVVRREPSAIVDALDELVASEALRAEMGAAAKRLAARAFDWARIAEAMVQAYADTIGTPSVAPSSTLADGGVR